MPLYEYQCDSCGHRFEVIQKFSDPHVSVCPKCGGPVQKLASSPAIQFKGSGFYITDYARSGKTDGGGKAGKTDKSEKGDKGEGASSGDSKPSTSGDTASSTASESKPAPSTPTKSE